MRGTGKGPRVRRRGRVQPESRSEATEAYAADSQSSIAYHPKALSKTELQNRLWPSTFVVEKNLARRSESFSSGTRRPGLSAPRELLSTRNSETDAVSPGAWGFFQEPRQRADKLYARLGSGAQWRVCSRAWAHPFKPASTDGLVIATSTP